MQKAVLENWTAFCVFIFIRNLLSCSHSSNIFIYYSAAVRMTNHNLHNSTTLYEKQYLSVLSSFQEIHILTVIGDLLISTSPFSPFTVLFLSFYFRSAPLYYRKSFPRQLRKFLFRNFYWLIYPFECHKHAQNVIRLRCDFQLRGFFVVFPLE